MSDQYEYQIDERTKAFAVKKLREDLSQVNFRIESLRRWVKSMPQLQCSTDAKFLLRFLRVAKFDEAKAQKRIQSFCEMQTSESAFPISVKSYITFQSIIDIFLNMKIMLPLGQIDSGEIIILIRYTVWDPDICSFANLIKAAFFAYDVIMMEEESQIFGMILLFDFCGVRKDVIEKMCVPQIVKNIFNALQDSYPVRFRGVTFCTESEYFNDFYKIVLSSVNDKLRRRTSWIRNDIKSLTNMYQGLDRILPNEYGGHRGTLDECAERWNEQFRRFYKGEEVFQNNNPDESEQSKNPLTPLQSHENFEKDIENF